MSIFQVSTMNVVAVTPGRCVHRRRHRQCRRRRSDPGTVSALGLSGLVEFRDRRARSF